MLRWLATLAVISHALIAHLHGQAHKELGVGLNEWQTWFVRLVILAAPWLAVVLVWTKWSRLGYALLALSMFGALVFGVYHHYIAVSNDHVDHLPPGDAQTIFKITAALLVATEAAAMLIGIYALRPIRKNLP